MMNITKIFLNVFLTVSLFSFNLHATVFLDDKANCTKFSTTVSDSQVEVINATMATHMHRLNHLLWHATRNAWNDLSKKERAMLTKISPEWGKHAEVCPIPTKNIANPVSVAGEEFLLMHHQMIDALRTKLVEQKQDCIAGWTHLPKKDDPNWPMPEGTADDTSKNDETGAMMQSWEKKINDPTFLRGKSLSYVGYLVEFSIHNFMHMRWAKIPKEHDDFSPMDSNFTTANLIKESEYDHPKYNWLGNPWSSHVSPAFWKLHGWVDNVIINWLAANKFKTIAADCSGKSKCYEWKTHWVGGINHTEMSKDMSPGSSHHHHADLTPEEEASLNSTLHRVFEKAGFRTLNFEKDLKKSLPTAGNDRGTKAPNPLFDPEIFVSKYHCN